MVVPLRWSTGQGVVQVLPVAWLGRRSRRVGQACRRGRTIARHLQGDDRAITGLRPSVERIMKNSRRQGDLQGQR
jgi:hypothetical protein